MDTADTIFALSSGHPPAAIGVIRISGPQAGKVLISLSGPLPQPRRASVRVIKNPATGDMLDNALLLWFPGPNTVTGENLAEIHCHGGRAVVRAIEGVMEAMEDCRRAEAGEFTRRSFLNGRIDLAEAEGLSDLLTAETELQRRAAVSAAGGALSRQIEQWQQTLIGLSALTEAELDFSDEDDVSLGNLEKIKERAAELAQNINAMLSRPRSEKLRDGLRVVLGGPPNAGKSSLINALTERDAAIVSEMAGTTRDVIEVPVSIAGIAFVFVDTAGLRDEGAEEIEKAGISRAVSQMQQSDIILWLGNEGEGPESRNVIEVASRGDHPNFAPKSDEAFIVSATTGKGLDMLIDVLIRAAKDILPTEHEVTINRRQAEHMVAVKKALDNILAETDLLIVAEELRLARSAIDRVTGRAGTEDMLDALFGSFCIGK